MPNRLAAAGNSVGLTVPPLCVNRPAAAGNPGGGGLTVVSGLGAPSRLAAAVDKGLGVSLLDANAMPAEAIVLIPGGLVTMPAKGFVLTRGLSDPALVCHPRLGFSNGLVVPCL